MNSLFSPGNLFTYNVGLLVIRVGIGIIYMIHGMPKIMGGYATWRGIAQSLLVLGVAAPTLLGFMAACSEGIGGLLLLLGLGTRIAAFFMACTMTVAVMYHRARGDAWAILSHPLSLLVVLIGLMIAGAGAYSFDSGFSL